MDALLFFIISILVFIVVYLTVKSSEKTLVFELHEKFTKKNKWLVCYEIRLIIVLLSTVSQIPFTTDSYSLFWYLLYLLIYGLLLFLFLSRNKLAFKLVFIVTAMETFSYSVSYGDNFNSYLCGLGVYTLFWLLPNYIYFQKRKTLFEQLNSNEKMSDIIIDNVEYKKCDIADKSQQDNLESTQITYDEISSSGSIHTLLQNDDEASKNNVKKDKLRILFSKLFMILSSLLAMLLYIGVPLLYVYTIYIYFTEYGFWQGFIGMCLPVLSTIWLCIQKWIEEGFNNTITLLGILSTVAILFSYAFAEFSIHLNEKK